jgi:hypothetical protein
VPLDLGVDFFQQRFDVSAVGRVSRALEGLHVLLRDRPRSISTCLRQQRHGFHLSADKPEDRTITRHTDGLGLPVIEVPSRSRRAEV